MGKPWENHGKIMGKSWENPGLVHQPWENHGKMEAYGGLMGLPFTMVFIWFYRDDHGIYYFYIDGSTLW